MTHTFFLDVSPNAAQRSQCTCRGRFATVYTNPKYREWKDTAVARLKEIAEFEDFRAVADRPVRITSEVVVTRPKTTKLSAPKPDVDNYLKGLWDAITQSEKWWADDSQIVEAHATKRWTRDGEPEGYRVKIEFL